MRSSALILGTSQERVTSFLAALREHGFAGEIAADAATRTVFSTDNSIYQVIPQAVLFPREPSDLNRIAMMAASPEFGPVALSARGGGTGTNGQSLTSGVIVDTSRHLNQILHFDAEKRLVTVGPGVVLDQLNAFLKPHGLFFPPTVSTASRATVGGMVATDASGKGSRIYGKTSDYIETMEVVLADGSDLTVAALTPEELEIVCARPDLAGAIHRELRRIVTEKAAQIAEIFPDMNRGLTGYNLQAVTGLDGRFHLARLLAGSEGTLALTKSITFRVLPRPAFRAIAAIRYAEFQVALADTQRLLSAHPAAIEILDDNVLTLALQDVVWTSIEPVLGGAPSMPVKGLNFVEFIGDTADAVRQQLGGLETLLAATPGIALDWIFVTDPQTVSTMWEMRKKSVGLLGRFGGKRQGIAFVEDTAVPPQHLAAYIMEFRALLDSHGLAYGMYGHADVGCLHVRPVLDMRDPADAARIRPISDAVAALTLKYGGLLWGEHGRGFRGEYSPMFFGPELYAELCQLKAVFDPLNILNPGKLATPDVSTKVDRIDGVPLRGDFDRNLSSVHAADYDRATACNGNGACHSWDRFDAMCPSFKATGDRTQSPKGRAALLREWARLDSRTGRSGEQTAALHDFEDLVKASLSTCLSCKACASQCPIKVDIPSMKARFLHSYHRRVGRSSRDTLVAAMEPTLSLARRMPKLANRIVTAGVVRNLLKRQFGLVDLPDLSPREVFRPRYADRTQLVSVGINRAVILLEDTFTASFDRRVPAAIESLLSQLGYTVHRIRPPANGKALHVLGYLARFSRVAKAARAQLKALQSSGLPVIGAEAITTLMHDHEYSVGSHPPTRPIMTIDQFLANEISAGLIEPPAQKTGDAFKLFLHCTEKTARPKTASHWTTVFSAFGLDVETPATGCCGMAGLFGHEVEHKDMSLSLFRMSWEPLLDGCDPDAVLATGFSCRCQIKRFSGFRPRHPAEALLQHLSSARS